MDTATTSDGNSNPLVNRFTEKARAVSAVVSRIASFQEAATYAVDLCGAQGACRITVSGCDEHLSASADALCHTKQQKIMAAPALPEDVFALLQSACAENGFACIRSGMRNHMGGVDIGFTIADLGIAETGTLVVDCPGEELRLATMLCEYHICVLRCSSLVADAFAAEQKLLASFKKTPNYTAFITGASRTADIERVLALGVHGPLELHILLLEG